MAKYSEYRDSGIPWIGKIPSHWSSLRAKFIFDRHKRPVRPFDEIVTCFRDGTVTLRKNRRETGFTNALMEFGYQGIRKGDLVVHQMDAFAGSIGVSDSDGKSTPVYTVCTLHDGKSSVWYYAFLLRVMANSDFIQSLSRGIRERSTAFGYDIMGNLILPIPPKEEQEAIVAYLDKVTAEIDKAIEAKERIIASLEERRKIIITHAVTRGINPDVPMRDSGIDWLGEIPAHWEIRRLKHLISSPLQYGANEAPDDYNENLPRYIRITDITLDGQLKEDNKVSLLESKSNNYILRKGDILFARSGATVGKAYLFNENIKACFAGYLINARVNNLIVPEYLMAYTQSKVYENWKNFIFNKATIQNIGADKYSNLQVPFPSIEEQHLIIEKISGELEPIDQAIAQQKRLIELLRERKNIIINETVTGKVKVI